MARCPPRDEKQSGPSGSADSAPDPGAPGIWYAANQRRLVRVQVIARRRAEECGLQAVPIAVTVPPAKTALQRLLDPIRRIEIEAPHVLIADRDQSSEPRVGLVAVERQVDRVDRIDHVLEHQEGADAGERVDREVEDADRWLEVLKSHRQRILDSKPEPPDHRVTEEDSARPIAARVLAQVRDRRTGRKQIGIREVIDLGPFVSCPFGTRQTAWHPDVNQRERQRRSHQTTDRRGGAANPRAAVRHGGIA